MHLQLATEKKNIEMKRNFNMRLNTIQYVNLFAVCAIALLDILR